MREVIIMVTNKDTLEKKGFLKGLGGRIKYLFNPASFDKAVNDGAEKTIIRVANVYEQATQWHRMQPPID